MNAPSLLTAFQLSFRAALSGGLAVFIAQSLEFRHPLYALVSAVLVSDLSTARTRHLGLHRIAGSVLGATVGAALSQVLPPNAWAVGLSVLVAMFLSIVLRLDSAAKLAGFVCAIIMFGYNEDTWAYALYRLMETTLGVCLAILVSFVPKLADEKAPGQDAWSGQ